MRVLFLGLAIALLVQQDEPWTPAPGNPGHRRPPEGWHCFTDSPVAPAPEGHACDCHKACHIDQGTGDRIIVEDPKCVVHCYRDNCRCAYTCPDT